MEILYTDHAVVVGAWWSVEAGSSGVIHKFVDSLYGI